MLGTTGYILHSRPYRESDSIVKLLTQQYGLLDVVVRGLRKPSRQGAEYRAALQLATKLALDLSVSYQGLSSLKQCEVHSLTPSLSTRQFALLSYINEITSLFVLAQQSSDSVFDAYEDALQAITENANVEFTLRHLEHVLVTKGLSSLDFNYDLQGARIQEEANYDLEANKGFSLNAQGVFSGLELSLMQLELMPADKSLSDLEEDEFKDNLIAGLDVHHSQAILQARKQLFRKLFAHLFPHKKLLSRGLFTASFEAAKS